jgi:anti-sigma factor (TIGR02949 family)
MSGEKDKPEIDDIGCIEAINGLYAYLDGEMEHHLGHCRNCFSRIELERTLTKRLKRSGKDHAPEKLQNRLRNLIDRF